MTIKKDIANFLNKINKEREATKGDTSRDGPEWAGTDSVSSNEENKGREEDDNKKGEDREREAVKMKMEKDIAEFFDKINKEREDTKGEASRTGLEWAASDSASKSSKGFYLWKGHKLPTPPLIAKVLTKPYDNKKKEKNHCQTQDPLSSETLPAHGNHLGESTGGDREQFQKCDV